MVGQWYGVCYIRARYFSSQRHGWGKQIDEWPWTGSHDPLSYWLVFLFSMFCQSPTNFDNRLYFRPANVAIISTQLNIMKGTSKIAKFVIESAASQRVLVVLLSAQILYRYTNYIAESTIATCSMQAYKNYHINHHQECYDC